MATGQQKRKRRDAGQWKAILERFDAGSTSVEAFCRLESISAASFYQWRKRLCGGGDQLAEAESPPFVDLGAVGGQPDWDLELELGGGVVLRLRRG